MSNGCQNPSTQKVFLRKMPEEFFALLLGVHVALHVLKHALLALDQMPKVVLLIRFTSHQAGSAGSVSERGTVHGRERPMADWL